MVDNKNKVYSGFQRKRVKMRFGALVSVFWLLWCIGEAVFAYPLANDLQAYDFCLDHKKSYIAIVWPIAQGKDEEVLSLLDAFGDIQYQKNVLFTQEQVYSLLASAHPKVKDIQSHVEWYFPPGVIQNPARVFVMQFRNLKTADACKHSIRHLFKMQYRPIHINDTHQETIELAEFFFNNNQTKNPFDYIKEEE